MASSQSSPLTFGQFKTDIRQIVWPTGEAPNHVVAHDKWFIDALMDLQASVQCLQQDNTDIVPHCATLFKCGLTVLDAPRGAILRVAVVDRLADDSTEDATADVDWCSELEYCQVDACHLHQFLSQNARKNLGPCSLGWYWGMTPFMCGFEIPEATDEGVDPALPALPLGHHYPQVSTDKARRARAGRWMLERGKIYIFPNIQSSESVILTWDGIKRTWSDNDIIDADPLLSSAVEEWQRWKHAERYDRDVGTAESAQTAYARARLELIHQCREETRTRWCETSHARSANVTSLFFNDTIGHANVVCPTGQTGDPVSVTIAVGTVSSSQSVADANQKANDAALAQASAQLVCVPDTATVGNDAGIQATAYCTADSGAPTPDGDPRTVIIQANTYFAETKDLANQLAQAAANEQAAALLTCTWWNRVADAHVACPEDGSITSDGHVPAHTFSSTLSQADADWQAMNDPTGGALALAHAQLVCGGGGPFGNTLLDMPPRATNCTVPGGPTGSHSCTVFIRVRVHADTVSRPTQQQANLDALNLATQLGIAYGQNLCSPTYCGRTFYIMVDTSGVHGPSLTPIP